jgi:hypothetical protein
MEIEMPLCLLRGWERKYEKTLTKTITTSSYELFKYSQSPGQVWGVGFSVSRSDIRYWLYLDGEQMISFTPGELNTLGVDNFSSVWPFLDRYDDANSIFSVEWSPEIAVDFRHDIRMVLNSPGVPWVLYDFTCHFIKLSDPKAYLESLKNAREGKWPT